MSCYSLFLTLCISEKNLQQPELQKDSPGSRTICFQSCLKGSLSRVLIRSRLILNGDPFPIAEQTWIDWTTFGRPNGVHLLEEGGNGQGDGSSLCQVKRKRVDLEGFRKRLLARFVRLSWAIPKRKKGARAKVAAPRAKLTSIHFCQRHIHRKRWMENNLTVGKLLFL